MKTLYDIESGEPYKVSDEHYKRHFDLIKQISQSITKGKGKVIITGTGGDMIKGDWKDIFMNPTKANGKT